MLDVTSEALDGYDPAHKCWKTVGFDSNATFTETLIRVANIQTMKQLGPGAKGTYEMRQTKEDGSVVTAGGSWVWSVFDEQKGTLNLTERVENGQKQPDMVYIQERMEKNPRKGKQSQ